MDWNESEFLSNCEVLTSVALCLKDLMGVPPTDTVIYGIQDMPCEGSCGTCQSRIEVLKIYDHPHHSQLLVETQIELWALPFTIRLCRAVISS